MKVLDAQRLHADTFAPFGSVFVRPRTEPLAETDAFSFWSDVARYAIDGETELSWCDVRRPASADWFEKHDRTPEILIPTDGPIVLPVLAADGEMAAFKIEVGQAVVIAPSVWHSACIPVGRSEAGYFVIFRRGTPSEDVVKTTVAPFTVRADEAA
jgi:ureidoglycolate hydrolase